MAIYQRYGIRQGLIMKNLQERLKRVLEAETPARGRFSELERLSAHEIPSASWTSVWHGRQRPTAEMIELVCQTWPQYALWIATGITEPTSGHEAPGLPGFDTQLQDQRAEHIYSKQLLEWKVFLFRKARSLMTDPHEEKMSEETAQKKALEGAWDYVRADSMAKNEREVNLKLDRQGKPPRKSSKSK